jgi:hypothetical protein
MKKKENIFASIYYLVVFVCVSLFLAVCFSLSLFHGEKKAYLS